MKKKIMSLLTFVLTLTLAASPVVAATSRTGQVKEKMAQNSDTVGWLRIPGAGVDEVVLQDPGARNEYYIHHGFDKEYQWYSGVCFADYRAAFGSGTPSELSRSTTLYGMWDKNLQRYYYDEPSFFEDNPLVYFSTESVDMVFQVVAFSEMHVDVPYNLPDLGGSDREAATLRQLQQNSILPRTEGIAAEDKLLIISMDVANYTDIQHFQDYRLALVAKLVRVGTASRGLPEGTVLPNYGPPTASEADR